MGDDDEDNPSLPPSLLQRSKSYYDQHAISNPLPRLLYSPPVNFGMVTHNLYRSSFPQKENFAYIRRLGLKSVLTLVQEDYPEENLAFLESAGINFFQFPIPGNKEPFVVIPDTSIIGALETILDKRNHPILVHCNAGKHRTGCLMGILRRLQGWALTPVLAEYRMYATPKERVMDQMFIELFDIRNLSGRVNKNNLELRWGVQIEEDQ